MEEKKILKITDKNGKEMEYEILSTFLFAKTEKNYVIYTDNIKDEQGNLNIYASIYYPFDDTKLDNIETEEEWNAVESILNRFK